VEVWQASSLQRLRLGEEKRKKKEEETTGQTYNGLPYSIGDHNKSSAVAEMGDGLAT